MPIFQVGIEVEKVKITDIIVKLNAPDEKSAYKLATETLRNIVYSRDKEKIKEILDKIESYEWYEEELEIEVVGESENKYPINHYKPTLDISYEETEENFVISENQLKLNLEGK